MWTIILDFLEALPVLARLVKFFRKSDNQKAQDVQNKVVSMSDADVQRELRDNWKR